MKWMARVTDGKLKLEGSGPEESGAEIYAQDDGLFALYEITQYGTAVLYYETYTNINEAIKEAESWT